MAHHSFCSRPNKQESKPGFRAQKNVDGIAEGKEATFCICCTILLSSKQKW